MITKESRRLPMVPVYHLHAKTEQRADAEPFVVRLCDNPARIKPLRENEALILDHAEDKPVDTEGFRAVFARHGADAEGAFRLPPELHYLGNEDVIRFDPRSGEFQVLYRRTSRSNSLLLTERCNSKCLMCSQPPRPHDDSYLVDDLLAAIPLMSPETETLGFTGGETTILQDRFIELVQATKNYLPNTRLDVLTNGRLMSYFQYARKVAAVGHPNLILCVPLYSDVDSLHDFVVQAKGAFDQTVRGIMNLGRVGVPVEIRVVIHQQTYRRLPQLAEFIARNLPFASHVALMGLEMMGFTRANLEALWIDPAEYQAELAEAVTTLEWSGIPTSIYNHQLCVLEQSLWPWSRQSISDWKNIYMPECDGCGIKEKCGGFFASAHLRYSDHIRPMEKI